MSAFAPEGGRFRDWSDADKETAVALYLAGQPVCLVADAIGRSVGSVRNYFNYRGVKRRGPNTYGSRAERRARDQALAAAVWTPARVALVEALLDEGLDATRVSLRTGVPEGMINRRFGYLRPVADVVGGRRRRRCLMCGQPFLSAGSGERVCHGCKATDAWRSGQDYSAYEVHL